jgi:hypothetical protein
MATKQEITLDIAKPVKNHKPPKLPSTNWEAESYEKEE